MNAKDTEFLKKLRETFKLEADEHIRAVTAGLLELEKSPPAGNQMEIIESVFREVHSLKGAARSVNLKDIEAICHTMENAFSSLKREEVTLTPVMCDLFHRCGDFITQLVSAMGAELSPQNKSYAGELVKQLESAVEGEDKAPLREPSAGAFPAPLGTGDKAGIAETVRMPLSQLDPLLYQAEEMILAKMAGVQRTVELEEINRQLGAWRTEAAQRRNRLSAANQQQWNEFYEWNDTQINSLQSQVVTITHATVQDQRGLGRMVDEHLESMKRVLMLPVSALTESFPKIVRNLSCDQGKDVDLIIGGGEIAIDKRILEELKDPLIHLLRNCVDHGMKNPQDRAARNKPPRGTIKVTFTAIENRQVEILIADDGEGIDVDRVRASAVKAGVLSRENAERTGREETLLFIYSSGVSTSPIITDVSGRGLGMAIVRERVEHLGGFISVETEIHVGTKFRLTVPLTLATFRGVLVRTGDFVFVLPTANVERAIRLSPKEIITVENRETISLNGQIISMVKLSQALGLPMVKQESQFQKASASIAEKSIPIVILTYGNMRIGFQVDEVLAEQQVLVKSLGRQLSRVRNIAGATVLGTGKVVPVLNIPDLMKSAVQTADEGKAAVLETKTDTKTGKILVVDDSITARTLIKGILETVGYHVTSAVDGAEALALTKIEDFDLIVSDVDMPRVSGFELVTRIRADKKLSQLPVVLVTALDSRNDRERGIEVGANAYIVKSSFDQSNLLEVIHRLL